MKAKFIYETGRWDSKSNSFVDRKKRFETKEVQMVIESSEDHDRATLRFIGGPTGYETYYIKDLLEHAPEGRMDFCICGGTINSWPTCIVEWADVTDFLEESYKGEDQS